MLLGVILATTRMHKCRRKRGAQELCWHSSYYTGTWRSSIYGEKTMDAYDEGGGYLVTGSRYAYYTRAATTPIISS